MQRQSLATSRRQTNAQPVSKQWLLWKNSPHNFIAELGFIWYRVSLWSVGVSCPGCAPSQSLAHPLSTSWEWRGGIRNSEGLDDPQALISNS